MKQIRLNTLKPLTLREAAGAGNLQHICDLLANGANISEMDNAPLRRALLHQQVDIVSFLISKGVNFQDHEAEFLKIAARNGDLASLNLLHPTGPRPFPWSPAKPDEIFEALLAAIKAGKIAAVQWLIANNALDGGELSKAMEVAGLIGNVPILQLLIEKEPDFDSEYFDALVAATANGHLSAVEFLIEARAGPEGLMYAQQVAAGEEQTEILEALIDTGWKLLNDPEIVVVANNKSTETLMLFIQHKYTLQPFANQIAVKAVDNGNHRILKLLLQHANVDQCVLDQGLLSAILKNFIDVVEVLLQNGANPSKNQSEGLNIAIYNSNFAMAEMLIDDGARVGDLSSKAKSIAFRKAECHFILQLLAFGVSVQDVSLTRNQARLFFKGCTQSARILRDNDGKAYPQYTRKERLLFVVRAAKKLRKSTAASLLITKIMREMQSLSLLPD